MNWIHETSTSLILNVKVKRFARETGVLGEKDGWLEVGVSEPPEKGKANKALVAFLAKQLRLAKSEIEIIRGAASPRKVVRFPKAMSCVEAARRLTTQIA
jgi:hypothetical protein